MKPNPRGFHGRRYARNVARGAQRSLVWGEKATKLWKGLLTRYEKQGNALLENPSVFVCPSHAIFLLPKNYAPQKKKSEMTVQALRELAKNMAMQEKLAQDIADETDDPIVKQLATTLVRSNRILGEDLHRESGFMLPQASITKEFLKEQLELNKDKDFPKEAVERLLELL